MTFDRLTDAIEQFTEAVGLDRYSLYMFDFGARSGSASPCAIPSASPDS